MKSKYPLYASILAMGIAMAQAQDTTTPTETTPEPTTPTETAPEPAPEPAPAPALSPGEDKVLSKIAGDFSETAGDDALPLVTALRTGSDISYEVETQVEVEVPALDADGNPIFQTNPDGTQVLDPDGNPIPETTTETQTKIETITVENSSGPMGVGNVKIAMTLAEKLLGEQNLDGNLANFTGALFGTDPASADGILELRAAGSGWGQISKQVLGSNLGGLVSGKNGAQKAERATGKPEQASRPAKADKPERVAKPQRPERPAKPDRPEKPAKPERPAKPDRPEKPAKPERPNR